LGLVTWRSGRAHPGKFLSQDFLIGGKRVIMKKNFMVLGLLCWFLMSAGQVLGQKTKPSADPPSFKEIQAEMTPGMVLSVSTLAVNMAYDYSQRPVIGVMVADFRDPQGREIVLGRDLAAWLRAGLNREKQFSVYGNSHPLSRLLESVMRLDPFFKPVWQRRLQEYLAGRHNSALPDLIITGTITRDGEQRLKVSIRLIPFYRKIRMVETETPEEAYTGKEFLSPPLSPEAMARAMAVIPKGRLVVLGQLHPKFDQTDPLKRNSSPRGDYVSVRHKGEKTKSSWDMKAPGDLNCWLDGGERKLPLVQIKDWPSWKESTYQDLFSGFESDTLWLDDSLEEGPHTLFFSLSSAKDRYKTFSRTIEIKPGIYHYLVFSLGLDAMGETDINFKLIVDPERTSRPF
jgi:hypothetical protein